LRGVTYFPAEPSSTLAWSPAG